MSMISGSCSPFEYQTYDHAAAILLPHRKIYTAVTAGDDLLIDDGRARVRVLDLQTQALEAVVIVGGIISDHKGVNIPNAVLDIFPLTTKDQRDLEFGLELEHF